MASMATELFTSILTGSLLSNWINLAAIITVTSFGIGTFAQQSVKTFTCGIPAPGEAALVPVAKNTSRGFNLLSTSTGFNRLTLFDTGMRSALITGLAGSPSLSSLPVECPTGNCTFGTSVSANYFSLAFDSFCADASGLLTQSNPTTWSQSNYSLNYSINPLFSAKYSIGGPEIAYDVEFFLSFRQSGRWHPALFMGPYMYGTTGILDLPPSTEEEEEIRNSKPFTLYLMIPRGSPCANDTDGIYQTLNDMEPLAAVNTTLCQTLESGNVTSYPGSFTLTAAVCYLYPSLRSYLGAIVNGQLQERPAASPKHLIRAQGFSALNISYFAFADPCIINNTVYSMSNYSDAPGLVTISGGFRDSVVNYTGPLDCLYSLPNDWDEAIRTTVGDVLTSPEDGDCYITSNYSDIVCADKWWLSVLYNGRNASISSVSRFMQNIADSLTLQLRSIGTDHDGNPAFARGFAIKTVVCTRFDWAWLIYPAVLTALTAVLLAAVALSGASSSNANIPWKTSLLPFLVYHLGPDVNDRHEFEETILPEGELETKAKRLRVGFSNVNGRWQFLSKGMTSGSL